MTLKLVTPVLGGAARPRSSDEVDIIRAASLRGQLRFWWRALYGADETTSDPLFKREAAIFGRAADNDGGRSAVELAVAVEQIGQLDMSDVKPFGRDQTVGAYALWPARAQSRGARDTAPRRLPGTTFRLTVRFASTLGDKQVEQAQRALKALVLFGGYGGRTRRGCGSFTVIADPDEVLQLPTSEKDLADFLRQFVSSKKPSDLPLLAGAGLCIGQAGGDAVRAWQEALGWLQDFRQGAAHRGDDPQRFAREAPSAPPFGRAGRSNWPEADKIRLLWARPGQELAHEVHAAHRSRTVVWPRAGFGLPIIGQFQTKDRNNERYRRPEPPPYELRWRKSDDSKSQDRLASPLIVKALPLAGGRFVPCALWLHRAYPEKGEVVLHFEKDQSARPGSAARFDDLVASGDRARFQPLAVGQKEPPGQRLRTAFFTWLRDTKRATEVSR